MPIIEWTKLEKEINGNVLFKSEHQTIEKKQRIGLIGMNGSGKSTLLKMLVGIDKDYKGHIKTNGNIYYLQQLIDENSTKSGGEQIKEKLDKAFSQQYDLLLLDEPTTNLDYTNIEFLMNRLKHYPGALMIVSHDRNFLNSVCTTTWEITNNEIFTFPGKYDVYEEDKKRKKIEQQRKYQNYQKTKGELEEAIENKRKTAAKVVNNKSKLKMENGASKPFFAKKQKKVAKSAKVLEKKLEQLQEEEAVKTEKAIIITPSGVENLNNRVLLRFNEFHLNIENRILIKPFNTEIKFGEKIALIGKNGSGKTTLLKAMQVNGDTLQMHPKIKFGYFSQTLDILDKQKTVLDNVMKNSIQPQYLVRTMLKQLGFGASTLEKQVDVLSGGERVRIALIKILVSDVNVLLLDEPTNYLDYHLLEVLEQILINYQGTLLFVSHDQSFVKNIASKIWKIEDYKLKIEPVESAFSLKEIRDLEKNNKQIVEEQLKIDLRLSVLIGEMSSTPSKELEEEYNILLKRKRELQQ